MAFDLISFSMIDQIIDFNKSFVAQKGYEKYLTDKYPDKKLAVLSCMDTRRIRWCRRISWFVGLSLIQKQEL